MGRRALTGGWSIPPFDSGVHRNTRHTASADPLTAPASWIAASAYAEQLG